MIAMEEISRHLPSIGLSYGAHSNLCVNQIRRHATPRKARYLPKWCGASTRPLRGVEVWRKNG